MRLSTGFYFQDLIRSVLVFADTPESVVCIERVINLFETDCRNAGQWQDASEMLGKLCYAHPDAYKESGTWLDGAPSLMAMGAAMEAASCVSHELCWGEDNKDGIARGKAFKAFKYVLRAFRDAGPDKAQSCLTWLERSLEIPPA